MVNLINLLTHSFEPPTALALGNEMWHQQMNYKLELIIISIHKTYFQYYPNVLTKYSDSGRSLSVSHWKCGHFTGVDPDVSEAHLLQHDSSIMRGG